MTLSFTEIDTPVGRLLLAGNEGSLSVLWFQSGARPRTPDPAWREDAFPLRQAINELQQYFAGRLQSFSLQLQPEGTAFQKSVWKELQTIPYGKTISYGELA